MALPCGGGSHRLFIGAKTMYMLKDVGFREARLNKSTSELLEDAQKASVWLWLRRTGTRNEEQTTPEKVSRRERQGDTPMFTAPPPGNVQG